MTDFLQKLEQKWKEKKFVCVGLDPDFEKLPSSIKSAQKGESVFQFNKAVIDATADIVCAFKPQSAFYEVLNSDGWIALEKTVEYIHQKYPDVPVIMDAKRGDIGTTNQGYIEAFFTRMSCDAITLHPYLGSEALRPFLDLKDKGIIILVRTSNPGSGEFQDLLVDGKPLYQVVAARIAKEWNKNNNCAVVVGATYPEELKAVREIIGEMPILIPGIGAQGGDLEAAVKNGLNSKGGGIIISSSRGIIYASSGDDFAQAARQATLKLNQDIVKFL